MEQEAVGAEEEAEGEGEGREEEKEEEKGGEEEKEADHKSFAARCFQIYTIRIQACRQMGCCSFASYKSAAKT